MDKTKTIAALVAVCCSVSSASAQLPGAAHKLVNWAGEADQSVLSGQFSQNQQFNNTQLSQGGSYGGGGGSYGYGGGAGMYQSSAGFMPSTFISVGPTAMKREGPRSQTLLQGANPGDADSLNANQFDFDYEVGLEASGRFWLGSKGLELRFYSIDSWAESISGSNAVIGSTDATYGSDFVSAECNFWCNLRSGAAFFFGFRWIELEDEMGLVDFDTFGTFQNAYRYNTNNHMYGGQIGGEGILAGYDVFTLETSLRAGIFHNSSDYSAEDSFGLFSQAESNGIAFAGEITITVTYMLGDHCGIRGGYQLLWMDSVSEAADQLPLPIDEIDSGSTFFAHGGVGSLVFVY